MPIEDRNLKSGTHLAGYYHKQSFTCEVGESESGKLWYRIADGREFKSLSAAGMAITGKACNGWAFWSLKTDTAAPPEATQKSTPVRNRIFRIPNQKGVPEGQTRWHCHDCGQSFLDGTGETPTACPQSHQSS